LSGIVIYEEDELMRALLQEWLSGAGYTLQVGTEFPVSAADTADLVIASIYMPKRAGAQLIKAIQAAHPGTPLIALSGQFRGGLSSAGATARCLGVAQVIAKPLTRDTLLQAVNAMMGLPESNTVHA
jgi:DNA-binding NtrC family response regulator